MRMNIYDRNARLLVSLRMYQYISTIICLGVRTDMCWRWLLQNVRSHLSIDDRRTENVLACRRISSSPNWSEEFSSFLYYFEWDWLAISFNWIRLGKPLDGYYYWFIYYCVTDGNVLLYQKYYIHYTTIQL